MFKRLEVNKGDRYGNLTVVCEGGEFTQPSGQKQRGIVCKCDCGEIKKIRLSHLRAGRVKSCGCILQRHGFVGTKLHNSWRAMKNRCNDSYFQSQYYYDKGISFYNGWNNYSDFMKWALNNGYKEGLQIDRIDNSKGYYPENCRWVTQEKNMCNRDVTYMVSYNGEVLPFMELLRSKGKIDKQSQIRARIKRGWNVEKAVDTPIRKGNYFTGKRNKRLKEPPK